MCEHEFVNFQGVHHQDGKTLNRPVNRELCCLCGTSRAEIDLESQLTAARAELAKEKAGREQAEASLRGLEILFEERTDNYYDCITEKRQAEAQCVAMRNCANCRFVNCDMTCDIDGTTVEPSLNCDDWEEQIGIEINADRLLAELQRYREAALSASSSAPRVQAAGEQGAPFDEHCPNPDVKGDAK